MSIFDKNAPNSVENERKGVVSTRDRVKSLAEVNADEALAELYTDARELLDNLRSGEVEAPANQFAQVMNSLANMLERIVKMRTDLYSADRVMKLEQILLRCLKGLPEATQEQFMKEYRRGLGDI